MPSRHAVARQTFISPEKFPFLEVRTTLESTQPYAEHFHSAFSFGLILEGGTSFTLMGRAHEALKGDIALIAPGLPHSCNPLHGRARSYRMAYLDAAWFARRICGPLGIASMYEVTKPVVRDPALFQQALAGLEAFCKGADDAEERFVAIFTELQRAHGCLASPAEQAGKKSAASLTAQKTDYPLATADLLQTNSSLLAADNGQPIPGHAPVSSLARRAGLRRETFSRAFRRSAGLPPNAWLHCLRLEKARALLRQGKSISEAALAAGYADQSHFHRMFVKFYSVTPGCCQRGWSHSYNTRT